MKQTTNYQLSQWEAEDQVLRTDFNSDNAKIDAALKALASGKADLSALTGLAKISYGSYIGNGQYGESHPNTLTFPFQPKFVLITALLAGNAADYIIAVQGQQICCNFNTNGGYTVACSWSGNSFKWSSNDAYVQYNLSGQTYFYVALG